MRISIRGRVSPLRLETVMRDFFKGAALEPSDYLTGVNVYFHVGKEGRRLNPVDASGERAELVTYWINKESVRRDGPYPVLFLEGARYSGDLSAVVNFLSSLDLDQSTISRILALNLDAQGHIQTGAQAVKLGTVIRMNVLLIIQDLARQAFADLAEMRTWLNFEGPNSAAPLTLMCDKGILGLHEVVGALWRLNKESRPTLIVR